MPIGLLTGGSRLLYFEERRPGWRLRIMNRAAAPAEYRTSPSFSWPRMRKRCLSSPRREHRSRRHHPQRARRPASRSGARRAAWPARPAPTASPRICARTAATSPTTTSRRLNGEIDAAAQSRDGGDRGDARRSRCGTGRTPPASCRSGARSARPRAASTSRGGATSSRRVVGELARRRHPRLAVHRARSAARSRRRSALGAPVVELHTGAYCERRSQATPTRVAASSSGLRDAAAPCRCSSASKCHAGHGLDLRHGRRRSPPSPRSSSSTSAIS